MVTPTTTTDTTVLRIPTYYRTSSYTHPPPPTQHPTTSASYIALHPSNPETRSITADARYWGWSMYTLSPCHPAHQSWLENYTALAEHTSWESDIWRIWQREHGMRIRHRSEVATGADMTPNQRALGLLKRLGRWFDMRRRGEGREWQLRDLEVGRERTNIERDGGEPVEEGFMEDAEGEENAGVRLWEARSLRGSFMERLEGLGGREGGRSAEGLGKGSAAAVQGQGQRRASVSCVEGSREGRSIREV